MAQELQYPTPEQLFPYSVKVEQSAKVARVLVHCYNNHLESAVRESIEAYLKVCRDLVQFGCKIAPEE